MLRPLSSPQRPAALPSPLLTRTLLACLAGLTIVQTAKFSGLAPHGEKTPLIDFNAFHIVGGMIWRGELDQAYSFEALRQVQRAFSGTDSFMPWTYPPPFDLVVAPLGLLPLWLAYLLFTGTSLAAYLLVLRRIAGEAFGAVLLATAPALFVTVVCGQNGFLTGALIGLACLGLRRGTPAAGIPLGLMAIKPHLAVCLAFHALATRRWAVSAIAAGVVAAFAACATFAFGTSVWGAFLHGVAEARAFLEAGLYPMYRMVSSYAFLLTLGVPAQIAMMLQGLVAVVALGCVGLALWRRMVPTQVLGLAALTSLLVSPYAYDYDLPIAGIGLALLLPDLVRLTTARERIVLLGLSWVVCGWSLVQAVLMTSRYGAAGPPDDVQPLSLGGAALPILVALVWRILQRDRQPALATGQALPDGRAAA